jgi:GT2 family glycosyltransferase
MSSSQSRHIGLSLMRLLRLVPYVCTVRRVSRGQDGLFDSEYYLAHNPDVAASWVPPLLHFLLFGAFERRKPNPLFDPEFYLEKYPDVAKAAVNPLLHYVRHGAIEGRKPNPLFEVDKGASPKRGSLAKFLNALRKAPDAVTYSWWMEQESRVAAPLASQTPRFSILLAVSSPRQDLLKAAIASVQAQGYPHWELCICDNASQALWVYDYLGSAERADARVRVIYLTSQVEECVALNHAATLATGDYLAVLGQEDCLRTDAFAWLATQTPAGVIYSDEDVLDTANHRTRPLFKPDWSPDLLLSYMYLGRVTAISSTAWRDCGGFREEYEGAAEYDLALRVAESGAMIRHLPRVLYSRREQPPIQLEAVQAAHRSLLDAVRRRGINATVEDGPRATSFRLKWNTRGAALVTIAVCSRSPQLLEQCLSSLADRTSYGRREIIVVQHLGKNAVALEAVIARHQATRLAYSGEFNFSRMNNLAAKAANGDILLFLNDDTEPIDPTWLERLVGQVKRPDVGIAGARLLYPRGTLQHGGVTVGVGDGCAHIGRDSQSPHGKWPWLDLTRDVSAVTGACLAIRTSLFREVGGFSEVFPVNYNDIDLCLRVRQAGYRVVYESGAVLRHYECQSRPGVVSPEECHRWYELWGDVMAPGDPFYNPNLTRRCEDLTLRSPVEDY